MAGGQQPSEEELRAAYEAELSRITATDMIAQATVSLLNLGARPARAPRAAGERAARGRGAERDLEQVRDAIDAAGALLAILERRIPPRSSRRCATRSRGCRWPTRREVSRPQADARPARGAAPAAASQRRPGRAGEQPAARSRRRRQPGAGPAGPGPAESSGRLWVPGS